MTKVDIFSGFLGAGKTTLIKKLIAEAYKGERLVLIENEFGDIAIDGGFLADAGINITEMNAGCICCSLVGDFGKALLQVLEQYHPDRILIEPSGVGKLSDVVRAVQNVGTDKLEIAALVTVADAAKCKMHMRNFGEFFGDQIAHAGAILLSHTKGLSEERLQAAVEALRAQNEDAVLVTTDWDQLTGEQLLAAITRTDTLQAAMALLHEEEACPVCGEIHHDHHHHDHDGECCHHDHHHDHDGECCHHEHHHDHDGECCHHDHHHDHDGECCHHEHHHHHDHDGECCHHDHHHHEHHHADEVFVSYGAETAKRYTKEGLLAALSALSDGARFGNVLRAKGIVASEGDTWLHFDYVPGEADVREGTAAIIGRLCVIGAGLQKQALSDLLGVCLK